MAVLLNLSPNLTDDFGGGVWTTYDSGTNNIVDGKFENNHAIELINRYVVYSLNGSQDNILDTTTQSYTLCCWLKATSWSGSGTAWMHINNSGTRDYGLGLYNGGTSFGGRYGGSTLYQKALFEADNTTWHFVALSCPAGTTGTLYIDGVGIDWNYSTNNYINHIRIGPSDDDGNAKLIIDDLCYLDYAIGNTVPTKYFTSNEKLAYLSNNSLYTGTSLTQLTNSWSTLSNAQKEALVSQFSEDMPTVSTLSTISPFKVLSDTISLNGIKVTGQPNVQTIVPNSLINTSAVSTVQSINITNNLTDTTVKFAITTDLSTYKIYDAIQEEWITSTNIENDGMSIAQINSLTPQVLALLDISNGIAFKHCFIPTSEDASAELSDISAVVDISGSWVQATHNTDYEVGYPNRTTMSVKLKTNGDYIINYPISSNS